MDQAWIPLVLAVNGAAALGIMGWWVTDAGKVFGLSKKQQLLGMATFVAAVNLVIFGPAFVLSLH